MYLKILFSISFLIILNGCQTSEPTLPIPQKYQKNTATSKPKKNNQKYTVNAPNIFYTPVAKPIVTKSVVRDLKFRGNGYIKGVIKTVYYDKKRHYWVYYIKGTDLSNGKLSSAEVYAVKKLAHVNDFVYSIIRDGFIKSIYIYKSSKNYTIKKKKTVLKKSKRKKIIRKAHKKIPKTGQRKQIISAPETQSITF